MPDIFALLSQHITFFPMVAFIGLLMAGCNLPVSEDLIIITAAILAHEEPSILLPSLFAIYAGAISTDYFVFWIGTRVRKGTAKSAFFRKFVSEKMLNKMLHYLEKYGILAFIVGRFIPFGARNALCFTAGFSGLRLKTFAIYEFIAAMISINTLFFITYQFGDSAKKPIKIAGIILFVVAVSAVIMLIIRVIIVWKRRNSGETPQE